MQLKGIGANCQGTVNPRTGEVHRVSRPPFLGRAFHVKLLLDMLGPLLRHFAGAGQPQVVLAVYVKIGHHFLLVFSMYKFKSRVTGDLIMLEPHGRQMLKILGRTDAAAQAKGILEPADMATAIAALEAAIHADEQRRKEAEEKALEEGLPPPGAEGVSLRQRATPFITMIRRCMEADKAIVWGV